jgi:predicted transcriptional regulator
MDKGSRARDWYGKVLGSLEHEVLDVLWAKGFASGRDVHAEIRRGRVLAVTTVLTVLDRLTRKGFVRKSRGESVYIFRPAYSKEEFAREVSRDVLEGILDISASGLCASLVDALAESDPSEFDRLKALIDRKKKELGREAG